MELWPMEAPGTPQVFSGDGQEIRALTFAARGGLLAATSEAAGQIGVKVWDLTSKQLLAEIKNAGGQLAFSFSPDGRSLATKDPRGHVKVWQARTGQELASPDSRVGPAISLAFSPDSQWLAIGSASGHAWLWKIGTPVVELLGGPSVGVAVFVFSPDGRTLIGNTFESLTLCWNVRSRKLLLRVPSYRPGLSFLLLSPDGSRLAVPSRSRERDLELWRFPTLDEIADASKQSHGNP
jgi:WD40 repeat protein